MGAEYKVHTKLLTEFETLGVMGENKSGIISHFTLHEFCLYSGHKKTPLWYICEEISPPGPK